MIFGDEAPWVFDKSPHTGKPKTTHCLLVADTHLMLCKPSGEIVTIESGTRDLVALNGTYCVQEAHNKPALGRIKVVRMSAIKNVRFLSESNLENCGFKTTDDFLQVWAYHHDHAFYKAAILGVGLRPLDVWLLLRDRPDHLYTAWAINFEVV